MPGAPMRLFLGFIAGAIAVLTFHQGMVALVYATGWGSMPPYRTHLVPPLYIPAIVSSCFWGGVYGALFGLAMARIRLPYWLSGLLLGLLAALVGWFVVAPLRGNPIGNGWVPMNMLRSVLINGVWGLGVGLILPLLMPRSLARNRS